MTREYKLTLEVYELGSAVGVECSTHVRENGSDWENIPPFSIEDDSENNTEAWLVSTIIARLDKIPGAREIRNMSADLKDLFYSVFLDKLAGHIEEHGTEGRMERYVNDARLIETLAEAAENELLLKLDGEDMEPALMENLKKILRLTASKVSKESIVKAVMRKSNVKDASRSIVQGEG